MLRPPSAAPPDAVRPGRGSSAFPHPGHRRQSQGTQGRGHDICSLSAGEPDFDTPAFICDAAAEALRSGHTRYGPAAGEPALRAAIAAKLSTENQVPTEADQVLVTNGGKQALYNLFQVLLDPGDELLLPAPYWLSYPEMARLAGASVKLLPCAAADGFRLNPAQLEGGDQPRQQAAGAQQPQQSHRHGAEPQRA